MYFVSSMHENSLIRVPKEPKKDNPSRISHPDLFLDYSVQVLSFSFCFAVFLECAKANDTQPNPITYDTRDVFQVTNLLTVTNADD